MLAERKITRMPCERCERELGHADRKLNRWVSSDGWSGCHRRGCHGRRRIGPDKVDEAMRVGVQVTRHDPAKIWLESDPISADIGHSAQQYFFRRHLYVPRWRWQRDERRLVAPITERHGRLIAVQTIDPRDGRKFTYGSPAGGGVYEMPRQADYAGAPDRMSCIVIVEGPEDAIAARILWSKTAVAICGVANAARFELPTQCGSVFLAMDNDDAGELATNVLLSRFPGAKRLRYDGKDPNDHLIQMMRNPRMKKGGPEAA